MRQTNCKVRGLAIELGVSTATVSAWRKGGPMRLAHAVQVSFYLQCSLSWLVLGENDEFTPWERAFICQLRKRPRREQEALFEFLRYQNL